MEMRDNLWLFIVVGKAALMTTLGYVALLWALLAFLALRLRWPPASNKY